MVYGIEWMILSILDWACSWSWLKVWLNYLKGNTSKLLTETSVSYLLDTPTFTYIIWLYKYASAECHTYDLSYWPLFIYTLQKTFLCSIYEVFVYLIMKHYYLNTTFPIIKYSYLIILWSLGDYVTVRLRLWCYFFTVSTCFVEEMTNEKLKINV